MEASDGNKTLFVANLSHRVTDDLIHELFLQAGPIEQCSIKNNKSNRVAIIEFKHDVSVSYAKDIFEGTSLHGRKLSITTTEPYPQPIDYGPNGDYCDKRYDPYQRNRNYSQQNHHNDYYGHDNERRNHSNRHDDSRRRHQPYHYDDHPRMRRFDNHYSGGYRH